MGVPHGNPAQAGLLTHDPSMTTQFGPVLEHEEGPGPGVGAGPSAEGPVIYVKLGLVTQYCMSLFTQGVKGEKAGPGVGGPGGPGVGGVGGVGPAVLHLLPSNTQPIHLPVQATSW